VVVLEELVIPKKGRKPNALIQTCLHLQMVFVCDPTKTQILDP
jgi:hypothetical protein